MSKLHTSTEKYIDEPIKKEILNNFQKMICARQRGEVELEELFEYRMNGALTEYGDLIKYGGVEEEQATN